MEKINNNSARIEQKGNYIFFSTNTIDVHDSFQHAKFFYSILNQINSYDFKYSYIIGLLGDSKIPNNAHYGVFSSILYETGESDEKKFKIIDFI